MTRDEIVQLARVAVEEEGWPWLEPVSVAAARRFLFFGRRTWRVTTNCDSIGCNAQIRIDDATGEIASKGFVPR